ncbi:MAG: hypothetical protein ACTS45_01415 [Candidatus Hodgkinia cicadicola]
MHSRTDLRRGRRTLHKPEGQHVLTCRRERCLHFRRGDRPKCTY